MKYVVLIPDGAADYPLEELQGRTPLQAADTPNIKELASQSTIGLAKTIPDGFAPGSDIANLAILGYNPRKYYAGRGPLEAAYHGIEVGLQDTVFRCNLITEKNGRLIDYSASHISTEDAAELIKKLESVLGSDKIKFFPGVSYRHLTVFKNTSFSSIQTVAPHDVIGQPVEELWPKGENADLLIELTKKSKEILENEPLNKRRQKEGLNPANMIWLWGSGQKRDLPSFVERFGLQGGVISAVDLLKGMAVSIGLKAVDIETATGYFDTDYEAKADGALAVLNDDDFVYIHVEAPDEAGHIGNTEEKIKAIERFDQRLMGRLLNKLDLNDTRIMLLPDHATPIAVKTHTNDAVPFMIYPGKSKAQDFSEQSAKQEATEVIEAHKLMAYFVKGSLN